MYTMNQQVQSRRRPSDEEDDDDDDDDKGSKDDYEDPVVVVDDHNLDSLVQLKRKRGSKTDDEYLSNTQSSSSHPYNAIPNNPATSEQQALYQKQVQLFTQQNIEQQQHVMQKLQQSLGSRGEHGNHAMIPQAMHAPMGDMAAKAQGMRTLAPMNNNGTPNGFDPMPVDSDVYKTLIKDIAEYPTIQFTSNLAWDETVGKRPPRDMKRLKQSVWYVVCRTAMWGETPSLYLRAWKNTDDNGFFKPPWNYFSYPFQIGDQIQLLTTGYSDSRNKVARDIAIYSINKVLYTQPKAGVVQTQIAKPKKKTKKAVASSQDSVGSSSNEHTFSSQGGADNNKAISTGNNNNGADQHSKSPKKQKTSAGNDGSNQYRDPNIGNMIAEANLLQQNKMNMQMNPNQNQSQNQPMNNSYQMSAAALAQQYMIPSMQSPSTMGSSQMNSDGSLPRTSSSSNFLLPRLMSIGSFAMQSPQDFPGQMMQARRSSKEHYLKPPGMMRASSKEQLFANSSTGTSDIANILSGFNANMFQTAGYPSYPSGLQLQQGMGMSSGSLNPNKSDENGNMNSGYPSLSANSDMMSQHTLFPTMSWTLGSNNLQGNQMGLTTPAISQTNSTGNDSSPNKISHSLGNQMSRIPSLPMMSMQPSATYSGNS